MCPDPCRGGRGASEVPAVPAVPVRGQRGASEELRRLRPAVTPQNFPPGMLRPGGRSSLVPGDSQDHPNVAAGFVLLPGRSAAAPLFWEQHCWEPSRGFLGALSCPEPVAWRAHTGPAVGRGHQAGPSLTCPCTQSEGNQAGSNAVICAHAHTLSLLPSEVISLSR